MTRIAWDLLDERYFESGVDRCVFYPKNSPGEPWSGIVSISESVEDVEADAYYVDGLRYFTHQTQEGFSAALVAFLYPDGVADGIFDLSYRTQVEGGYKIHLIYNVNAEPQAFNFESLNQSSDAINFGFDLTTIPENVRDLTPSAHLVIDSRFAYPETMDAIEDLLYGSDYANASLPSAEDIVELFDGFAVLKITDYGDGTWSADGPDDIVYMTDSETFAIDYISAQYLDEVSYTVYSL